MATLKTISNYLKTALESLPLTAGLGLPKGTTAQRGSNDGMVRYNTTTSKLEGKEGGSWVNLVGAETDADIVALAAVSTTGMLARTGSGTWSTRTITGTAGEIDVADGNGVSGNPTLSLPDLARTKLATESAAPYSLDLQNLRNDDGSIMDASGGAGKFAITNGTHSAPGLKLVGETANNNTKTDYLSFVFVLPPEYVAGSNVVCAVTVDLEGAGTAGTNTIDVLAFELNDAGAVGSDICATAVQNLAASPTERNFTITGTDLVPGDKLLVYLEMVLQETISTDLNGAITDVTMKVDIKG